MASQSCEPKSSLYHLIERLTNSGASVSFLAPNISAKRHQLTCSCHQEDLKPTVPWSALVQLCSIHYCKYNTSAPGFICTMAIDWGEIGWPIRMHYNSWALFICRPCNALSFPRIPRLSDNFGNRQAGTFVSLAHQSYMLIWLPQPPHSFLP